MTLFLREFSPQHLLALLDGPDTFRARFGLSAAEGLREFYVSDDVSPEFTARLRAASTADPWHFGFAVIDQEANLVVGCAGFKGPPDKDGTVEIAYGIVPDFEGRGYGTQAAADLVAFASCDSRVFRIQAHTRPATNASTRVLTKNGFVCTGEVCDPNDGPVWRWERSNVDF